MDVLAQTRNMQEHVKSVELFTGAGGLAVGIKSAGFQDDTVVERNKYCSIVPGGRGR
jgi:site-specific DNA-cytosine methylase